MSKQGSYHVNGSGPKDTSFKSFICALLVFLALCIVIYVILAVGRHSATKNEDDNEVEVFEETNDKSERDKLTAGKRPDKTKEKEGTTTTTHRPKPTKTLRSKTTPRYKTATKSYEEGKNAAPATSESTSTSDIKTTTEEEESSTPAHQSEYEKDKDKLKQFVSTTELTTGNETTESSTVSEGSTEKQTTPQLIDDKEKEQFEKYKIIAKSPLLTDLETTTDYSTESTSEESATVSLGIDHDIFHGHSTTENAENSTPAVINAYATTSKVTNSTENDDSNTQTTTDKPVEVIMGVQKGTMKNEPYVYLTTETQLTTDDNLLSTTEPNFFGSRVDNKKLSTTTDASVIGSTITEADSPKTGQSNATSSSTDDLQSVTTETIYSAVTNPMLRTLQKTTDSSSTTSKNTEPTTVIATTTDDSVTSRLIHAQTTVQHTTQSSVNLQTQDTTVANMQIALSATTIPPTTTQALSATTIPPTTTQQSVVKIAGVPTKYLPVKQCNTTICKKVTSKMVNMMNHAADPCDNFYDFACGGQENDENNVEEANSEALLFYITKINASSEKYLQDFQKFHQSCVEHERDFILSERMKIIEDVPDYNLTELFVELILTQSMPLFDVGLDIGPSQDYKLQITLPGRSSLRTTVDGWSVSDQIRKICLHEQNHLTVSSTVNLDDVYESYKNCQKKRLKISAINFVDNMKPFVKDPSSTIFNDFNLARTLSFLDKMQNLLPPDNEIRETQLNRTYIPISIMELNRAYNVVDWATILERLTFNSTFSDTDIVDVYFADYFSDVLITLRQYTERELVDILTLYSKYQLYENTVIPRNQENRETYCTELSRQLMPDIVSTVIYELAHHGKQLNLQNVKIKILFQKLTDQFRESLKNSRLDDTSKNELLTKLDRIKLGLITTGNYNATRKNYIKTTVLEDEYQRNVVELIKNYKNIIYSLERTKASASNLLIYFVDHFNTQPKSFYPSEYIVFHPAVLQKTSMDLPPYLQLSKVGLHLSRELTRHFDPAGRHFLTTSQISSSDNYYNNLIHRTADLLELYANSTYDLQEKTLNFKINGTLLLNEMIADNAAFRLIYDSFALLKDQDNLPWIFHSYTIEKVFFIAAAQEYCEKTTALSFLEDIYETDHLPSPLKIQNIISNSKEFAETFQCVDGSAMTIYEGLITQFPYIDYTDDYSYTNFYN